MINTLRLLQVKYSLSNEFIANAIRAEIERQALLDIKGVISNASVTSLSNVIGKLTDKADPLANTTGVKPDPHIAAERLVAPASKVKGNRRGR